MFLGHSLIGWIAILVGGFLIGALCGLVPLIVGLRKNKATLGTVGFVACIFGGIVFGIVLAAPIAIVFTVILCVAAPKPPSFPGPGQPGGSWPPPPTPPTGPGF